MGAISPSQVYNHPAAVKSPWIWALIHGGFVSGAAIVYVVQWRLNEGARNEARELYKKLYEGQLSVVHQLEEAATMKDELVSIVSHELRTPLTSVIGYVSLLRDRTGFDEIEVDECVERIARQADRLQFLVENLLNYRAIEAESSATVEVAGIVEEVIAAQTEAPGADRLWFHRELTTGLAAQASDKALRLITSNLVNNAVKFSPPDRTITIATRAVGDFVELSVTNEGQPIAASDSERIFGAFVQLDSSSTRTVPGVGLGLHIVRRTVDAHHGDVTVTCGNGRVTFTVRLPMASSSHAAA
jgi:signal transduction histidine kinase